MLASFDLNALHKFLANGVLSRKGVATVFTSTAEGLLFGSAIVSLTGLCLDLTRTEHSQLSA
jgi:hypothetical protein